MRTLLAQILLSAVASMWKRQPTLGKYTSETREREPDLTTHYGRELETWFPWLHLNFDLIKPGFGDQRPDIVLHVRNSNAANFLVIEVKREANRGEAPADLNKIRNQWFKGKLRYRYGASLILDENDHSNAEASVLFRDEPEEEVLLKLSDLSRHVPPPTKSALKKSALWKLTEQVVATEKESPVADRGAQEREIDELVYALYGLTPEEIKIVEGGSNKHTARAESGAK